MNIQLCVNIYRQYNLDLRDLTDFDLTEHFKHNQHEPRIYGETKNTAEFLSMRWLRGKGLEIGAGSNPTPLFGNATAIFNDCDGSLAFGGDRLDFQCSIDDPIFGKSAKNEFDFVVASHVLEHTDSFLRAIENLISVTKINGVIYIVLPDIEFLHDKTWLPFFDFNHHIEEYTDPLKYAKLHDNLYIAASGGGIFQKNEHAYLSETYKQSVWNGEIPTDQRFLHHKHNYGFNKWLALILRTQQFFDNYISIVDVRYGHERMDCHFVLKVDAHGLRADL